MASLRFAGTLRTSPCTRAIQNRIDIAWPGLAGAVETFGEGVLQ